MMEYRKMNENGDRIEQLHKVEHQGRMEYLV